MPEIYVGTSGFSYPKWKGHFYPEKLSDKSMLGYYSERLRSVEINNTFYRLPRREVLESWKKQATDGFLFAIKASRRITHQHRLNEGSASPLAYLLENLEALDDKLGCVLFQLPPYMKKNLERLESFLDLLPGELPCAFEFRNPSWFDDDVYAALASHDAALVLQDTGDEEKDPPFVRTAGWGYLRLRRKSYENEELTKWADRLSDDAWSRSFVYFKHEDEGAGPRLAKQLEDLVS